MTALEQIFEMLAFVTWDIIGNAYCNHIAYGEDAITSLNLLTLKNTRSRKLVVVDTRVDESVKGCDFEFWVGADTRGWHRYAIQAKKLNVSNERYNSLGHKVNGIPQIAILDQYAVANNAIPLYCLFNHSVHHQSIRSNCISFRNIKELGCSITPLSTVRLSLNTRGARTFNWFHNRPETLPWSCLVRCSQLSRQWPTVNTGFDFDGAAHATLPEDLSQMIDGNITVAQLLDSRLFSSDVKLRPAFIGVIDISEKDDSPDVSAVSCIGG
ncbi:hypothetical protein HF563_16290 [Acidithiobacillus ferridurans]|nr:hypothetical protein [Acidithiobacillus ferridurans]